MARKITPLPSFRACRGISACALILLTLLTLLTLLSTSARADSPSPGFRVYNTAVDCRLEDPGVPELPMPFEETTDTGSLGQYIYICIDGEGTLSVDFTAEYLGKYGTSVAYMQCNQDSLPYSCNDFETIEPPLQILYEVGSCRHELREFSGNVEVFPGRYLIRVFGGSSVRCDSGRFNHIMANVQGIVIPPTPTPEPTPTPRIPQILPNITPIDATALFVDNPIIWQLPRTMLDKIGVSNFRDAGAVTLALVGIARLLSGRRTLRTARLPKPCPPPPCPPENEQ